MRLLAARPARIVRDHPIWAARNSWRDVGNYRVLTALRIVRVPSMSVLTAIITRNFLLPNFRTRYAATGVENPTPMDNSAASVQSMLVPNAMYVSTAAMHVTPSAREVMAMAARASTPVMSWPAVTRGPYPPPLRPLLKAAIEPTKSSRTHEKSRSLFPVTSTSTPMTTTNAPMYKFSANLDLERKQDRNYRSKQAQARQLPRRAVSRGPAVAGRSPRRWPGVPAPTRPVSSASPRWATRRWGARCRCQRASVASAAGRIPG